MTAMGRSLGLGTAVVLALGLTACTVGGEPASTDPVVQLGAPGEPNRTLSPDEIGELGVPEHVDADVTFMLDMIDHHSQALVMTGYVKERTAFGQPVGSFQHNKFKVAELVTAVDVSQAFVDQCVLEHCAGELSAVDAAKAKWWSAQVQNDVLDECVQLHGGYGFMNEYRVARAWRDARVTKIWAGSNEIMKELIGRDLGL